MGGSGGTYRVANRVEQFRGPVFQVVSDDLVTPAGDQVVRDYVVHVGAVGVVALDDDGRVVLVQQYRHALRRELWELPAGLVDQEGESLADVAARELAEETDLVAGQLDLLVDLHTSPGCSNEHIRIFLARDLTPAPHQHAREHEEATMIVARFPLDEAVRMAFAGDITNASCVAGLLAAARARDQAWAPIRPSRTAGPAPALDT